jgi:hypothetical protein
VPVPSQDMGFDVICPGCWVFFVFSDLWWKVIVRVVDIGGIVDYHCLNLLFITENNKTTCHDLIHVYTKDVAERSKALGTRLSNLCVVVYQRCEFEFRWGRTKTIVSSKSNSNTVGFIFEREKYIYSSIVNNIVSLML